ncbi:H-NS family nucleoid-associated regulatory protein [Cognatishimia sp. F0-27]|uniref:H-NS histone family protein n=1 Tax=Cognatishimia sp. F0-27 TaxID=2816855 RepID=UPI00351CDE70
MDIIESAQKALRTVETRRRAEAKKAAEQAAKEFGFSLEEVLGGAPKASKQTKGVPKYANPADKSQTWTGRGRKPQWVIDALENGHSLDELAL